MIQDFYKLLFLVIFLSGINVQAQGLEFEWAKQSNGISFCQPFDVTTDIFGNSITVGIFEDTVDFDPSMGVETHISNGQYDMFIQKIDSLGNLQWIRSIGGLSQDYARSVKTDRFGNVYLTGSFSNSVDFNPGSGMSVLNANGGWDAFVLKLDFSGDFVWVKHLGGAGEDIGRSIAIDGTDNILISGLFSQSVDFDPGTGVNTLVSSGNRDAFILKLNSLGNYVWSVGFGGVNNEMIYSLKTDDLGNMYSIGDFTSLTVDFDPRISTFMVDLEGTNNIFVQKLDSNGNFLWVKSFGGSSAAYATDIDISLDTSVYITGYFNDTLELDTFNLVSNGSSDVLVAKLDELGNLLWANKTGGGGFDYPVSLEVGLFNNAYVSGVFAGTVDFDPGIGVHEISSVGSDDAFIQKMDHQGNYIWTKSLPENGPSFSILCLDYLNNVYLSGYFVQSIDANFGTGASNLISSAIDAFLIKLSPCIFKSSLDEQTACDSYNWIDGNTYTASNNTATYRYNTFNGCDSVITLDLTINSLTTSTDVITACDSYTWIDGVTYTNSNNTATQTLINAAGCDSIITLDLTINTVSNIMTTLNGATIMASNSSATYQWLDCDNNFAPISGGTNQSYSAITNGNYAVEINQNSCVDTSACINVTSIGIEDLAENIKILSYPNPTKGIIYLEFSQSLEDVTLIITDINGALIANERYDSLLATNIELNGASGICFLTIKTLEGNRTIKLFKE